MEKFLSKKNCKYCEEDLQICLDEGLLCSECNSHVHIRCLKRGSVPGGLHGDLFFQYTCQECSNDDEEKFIRLKLSWLQALTLTFYHLQCENSGLARNGFFHWQHHIVTFIDRNWNHLFPNEKRKKKWVGTVSGRLSHHSSYIFLSGGKLLNKTAWWTLMYPKLTPYAVTEVYNIMTMEKQKDKIKNSNQRRFPTDAEHFTDVLNRCIHDEKLIQIFDLQINGNMSVGAKIEEDISEIKTNKARWQKRRFHFSTLNSEVSKKFKSSDAKSFLSLLETPLISSSSTSTISSSSSHGTVVQSTGNNNRTNDNCTENQSSKPLLDPMCYFNTSLNSISRLKMQKLHVKLTGGIRKEMILSPYSGIYLRPYIRRDVETFPLWLKLMAELLLVTNQNNDNFALPSRDPIDYVYVQPEHIPAINSLANHFFWPGIDLTDSLQYPEYSCVVIYKRLIIAFAFMVPDVKHTENYISFILTRPGWRNCGIAKFMIYHLIQVSLGKDITLHVSVDNSAIYLYQKFGFKVENVMVNFYDKYFRNDVKNSKTAFFCRLDRTILK